MNRTTLDRRFQVSFWVSLVLLILYAFPIFSAPLAYTLSNRFADAHWLYYTFVPFLGERHGLIANLARLLAPLLAGFAAVAFSGRRNISRTITITMLLIVALALSLFDIALLTNERNLRSLNAHEIQAAELTVAGIEFALERYQEVLLALLAAVLGLTLASPLDRK